MTSGQEAWFIEGKLAERDARHQRIGDSRYLLEPNIKESKGGLRDLQMLMWLARFIYGIETTDELLNCGVLDRHALTRFQKSKRFLMNVRCHLHFLTGRAEERLTFDVQPQIAELLGYQKRPGVKAVERFMRHYYLIAKDVGALTRIVLRIA